MIELHVLPDAEAVGVAAADAIDAVVRRGSCVLGLATGSSPDRVYDELARRHADEPRPWASSRVFILDEYVGLPTDHPERYAAVIRRAITDRVGIPSGRVHAPDVDAEDLSAAAGQYDAAIADAGGIDLQLLGVGVNGHIAFNEPGAPLDGGTHVAQLTAQTRRDNARFFHGDLAAVPRTAMTQGIGTILRSRRALLVATGAAKAEAVAALATREPTSAVPVTALHRHPSVLALVDAAAASELDERSVRPDVRIVRQTRVPEAAGR
ncbi:glucosamine-6-phosphate deaminase [Agromyces aerolatus]|uniref:glucosamine-6-phosphate deaminase n=1 Tax=Agromyces sp. LY-1074 TaxID=3074080 RepID=UPI002861C739|nr:MULTISPECIES: glucosamine-6-phosphate deaminase [unclassified Agromyces]MDR5699240.1 glucosamine-6-phosphate deaminase [Agromyces sp. LY-1074]MDR5705536.1 glucosamine-6-phosphate deaminase [Agromyces sp. LY-1358]